MGSIKTISVGGRAGGVEAGVSAWAVIWLGDEGDWTVGVSIPQAERNTTILGSRILPTTWRV